MATLFEEARRWRDAQHARLPTTIAKLLIWMPNRRLVPKPSRILYSGLAFTNTLVRQLWIQVFVPDEWADAGIQPSVSRDQTLLKRKLLWVSYSDRNWLKLPYMCSPQSGAMRSKTSDSLVWRQANGHAGTVAICRAVLQGRSRQRFHFDVGDPIRIEIPMPHMRLSLSNTYCAFSNEIYRQVYNTAMSASIFVTRANVALESIEITALKSFGCPANFFLRYMMTASVRYADVITYLFLTASSMLRQESNYRVPKSSA